MRWVVSVWLVGCVGGQKDPGAGTREDTDLEGDADTDADSDADTDADSDADTDADSDADTHTDSVDTGPSHTGVEVPPDTGAPSSDPPRPDTAPDTGFLPLDTDSGWSFSVHSDTYAWWWDSDGQDSEDWFETDGGSGPWWADSDSQVDSLGDSALDSAGPDSAWDTGALDTGVVLVAAWEGHRGVATVEYVQTFSYSGHEDYSIGRAVDTDRGDGVATPTYREDCAWRWKLEAVASGPNSGCADWDGNPCEFSFLVDAVYEGQVIGGAACPSQNGADLQRNIGYTPHFYVLGSDLGPTFVEEVENVGWWPMNPFAGSSLFNYAETAPDGVAETFTYSVPSYVTYY